MRVRLSTKLHAAEDHKSDDDREDAVALHDDIAEHEGAAQGRGSAIGIGEAPQIAWIACSATIRPPIVTRICLRWLP